MNGLRRRQGFGNRKRKCFVAFDLPKEVVREIERIQGELKKKRFFVGRYVEPEMMHVTLKFLGNVDSEDLVLIRRRLKEVDFSEFEVALSDIDIFDKRNPRVLYVGLKGKGIWELRKKICEVLGDSFEEEKEFKPHLTLCRINRVFDKREFFEEIGRVCVCKKKFVARNFSLVESVTRYKGKDKGGVFYRVLNEFKLR